MTLASENTRPPWYRQIATVIFSHWILKSIGITFFISLFFVAYFYLLNNPAYPTTVMPIITLDRLIGFQPLALPLYLSIWVYISLPPVLLTRRHEFGNYATGMTATCLSGLLMFYFWPTIVPAGAIDWTQSPQMDLLKHIDAAGNACPSLHVATAVFSALWLHRQLRHFGTPMSILVLNWTWCGGILYSTLATRQHVAVDVLAGLTLGALAGCLSLRRYKHSGMVRLATHREP